MALDVPGTKLEGAMANVAEDAGKTLVGALRTRLSAWVAKKAAADLAEADQIRLNAEAEGERERTRLAIRVRRELELEEVDHRLALIERARGRVLDDIAHTQEAIEYVGELALQLNAADSEKADERPVDDDWLRRFFRYVAEVDEKVILEVFAQALSDAAIRTRPLLSPRALDALRFFDPETKEMFELCADAVGALEALPRGYLENHAQRLGHDLDISLMLEMGLLKYEKQSHYLVMMGEFHLNVFFGPASQTEIELVRLTHVGRSIAGLFRPELRRLGDPLLYAGTSAELLALQTALALTPEMARSLGKSLVATLSNAEGVELIVRIERDDIFHGKKAKYDDPFGLDQLDLSGLSEQASGLVACLLEEFADFDAKQRHSLREAAQGSAR